MRILLAILFGAAFTAGAVAPAQANPLYVDLEQLDAIDQAFVCPEDLHTVDERMESLAKFLAAMEHAIEKPTFYDLQEYRIYFLRKHKCAGTLGYIRDNDQRILNYNP